jgi:hypothetical protein
MTSPSRIELCQDLDGVLYGEFIRYAFATSNEVYFVVRGEVQKGPNVAAVVKRVAAHLIAEQEVCEWPGTRLHSGLVARLFKFSTADPVMRLFLDVTDHLYGWQHPDLPEDIGFRDREGRVVIESTTHEHYLSMTVGSTRRTILDEERFPNLALVLLSDA